MIRRELQRAVGTDEWLLVSQVEHAQVSGALASAWKADDLSPRACDGQTLAAETTAEILAAITHHDDGWAAWEAAPRIDPEHGRPFSFISEMPFEESLAIWDGSIAAAGEIGPLAGWMVAGHFYELLAGSGDVAKERTSSDWLDATERRRGKWLQVWLAASPDNSTRIADRALRLLQLTDVLSLWLFRICPLTAEGDPPDAEPFELHWPHSETGPYRFTPIGCTSTRPGGAKPVGLSGWSVAGVPWPFAEAVLYLTAQAWLVPKRRYSSTEDLVNVRRQAKLEWRLTAGS
jgi:hypothetical protein